MALLACEGYKGLVLLCSSIHGERLAGSRAVLRGLLPGILMAEKEQRADLTGKERAVIREHGLNFVLHLVESAADEVERKEREEAAVLLVHHMAAKVPDESSVSIYVIYLSRCLTRPTGGARQLQEFSP